MSLQWGIALRTANESAVASDEDLARRVAAGDREAFAVLVERYQRPLYNFALRFIGNPDDAEDAAQETLIQVYQALPVSRLEFAFRPWLYRIARNKCIDLLRRTRALPFSAVDGESDDEGSALEASVPDRGPLPEELAERADLQRLLHEAIDALPLKYRTVVTLRYVADLTFAEIAASLGLPENTVKTHFQRAKAMLRAHLHQQEVGR